MALKTRPPRQERIDGLPPYMTQYLPPFPRKPLRYLGYSIALSIAFSMVLTVGWVIIGLPQSVWSVVLCSALSCAFAVGYTLWQDARWRHRNPPIPPEEAVGIMMLRYLAANKESAPWN